MKVSHRLYITVAPGVLGVAILAGLAYWGEYGRQAPETLVVVAGLTAFVSLGLAWVNARFVANRIERLADAAVRPSDVWDAPTAGSALRGVVSAVAPHHAARLPDEIDAIEQTVDRLSRAASVAEHDRADAERRLGERVRDHARLMLAVADDAARQLDEVRLPLHILLDNRFGELNENQEEMLGSARAAAETIDSELVSLRRIAELELGERELVRDRVRTDDIIAGIRPILAAASEAEGSTLKTSVDPLLPALIVDRLEVQHALATLFKLAIVGAGPDRELELGVKAIAMPVGGASRAARAIEVALRGGVDPPRSIQVALAARIIAAHEGIVHRAPGLTVVDLPLPET